MMKWRIIPVIFFSLVIVVMGLYLLTCKSCNHRKFDREDKIHLIMFIGIGVFYFTMSIIVMLV